MPAALQSTGGISWRFSREIYRDLKHRAGSDGRRQIAPLPCSGSRARTRTATSCGLQKSQLGELKASPCQGRGRLPFQAFRLPSSPFLSQAACSAFLGPAPGSLPSSSRAASPALPRGGEGSQGAAQPRGLQAGGHVRSHPASGYAGCRRTSVLHDGADGFTAERPPPRARPPGTGRGPREGTVAALASCPGGPVH